MDGPFDEKKAVQRIVCRRSSKMKVDDPKRAVKKGKTARSRGMKVDGLFRSRKNRIHHFDNLPYFSMNSNLFSFFFIFSPLTYKSLSVLIFQIFSIYIIVNCIFLYLWFLLF